MNAIEELAGISAELKGLAVEAEGNLDNLWIDPHVIYKIDGLVRRIESEYMELPRDADGEVIHIGDVASNKSGGIKLDIMGIGVDKGQSFVTYAREGYNYDWCDKVHHVHPDTWEKIEEDSDKDPRGYWGCRGILCGNCPAEVRGKNPMVRYEAETCYIAQKRDLISHYKKLAGVE